MKKKKLLLIIALVILLIAIVGSVIVFFVFKECKHEWSDWTIIMEPTCVNSGSQERTCAKCDDVESIPIEAFGHTPSADDGDCTTDILCSVCNAVTTEGLSVHKGGTATCEQLAKCEVCGKEYGELTAHIPNTDDGDCTTDILCSVCGIVTTQGNPTHTGGTATCSSKAACEVCGIEYGDLAAHEGDIVWIKLLNTHHHAYTCCYIATDTAEPHTLVSGVCSVCGFNPTINITSVTVAPGATDVGISLSVTDNPAIIGLMITLQYDSSVLTVTKAESGAALENLTFTAPSEFANGCTFLWDGLNMDLKDMKDGELLKLTFDVAANAPVGEYTIYLNITAYDNDLNPFTLTLTGGKITVTNN